MAPSHGLRLGDHGEDGYFLLSHLFPQGGRLVWARVRVNPESDLNQALIP